MKWLITLIIALTISTPANAGTILKGSFLSKAYCFPQYGLCFDIAPEPTYVIETGLVIFGGCVLAGQLVNMFYVGEILKQRRTREDEHIALVSCILPIIGPWLVHQAWKNKKAEPLLWHYDPKNVMFSMHGP